MMSRLARKAERAQQAIDSHLTEHKLANQVVPYSDKLFKKVAIEWLMVTDQVHLPSSMRLHFLIFVI